MFEKKAETIFFQLLFAEVEYRTTTMKEKIIRILVYERRNLRNYAFINE